MTDNPRPHVLCVRAASCLVILFLLLLFIITQRQVKNLSLSLLPLAHSATEAVVREDWEQARMATLRMYENYLPYDKQLRLYMDHQDVDLLHMRLLSCKNLARVEDEQIIVDLEELKSKLDYLANVGALKLWNLL